MKANSEITLMRNFLSPLPHQHCDHRITPLLLIIVIIIITITIIAITSNLMTCTPGYYANTFAPASTFGHPASTFGFFNQVGKVMLVRKTILTKMNMVMSMVKKIEGGLQFHNQGSIHKGQWQLHGQKF